MPATALSHAAGDQVDTVRPACYVSPGSGVASGKGGGTLGRLLVQVEMVDDDGTPRLRAVLDEPTRLDVDRDPLYVYARLEAIAERALSELHDQALQLNERAWPTPRAST